MQLPFFTQSHTSEKLSRTFIPSKEEETIACMQNMAVTLEGNGSSYDLKLKENDEWDENEEYDEPVSLSSHASILRFP